MTEPRMTEPYTTQPLKIFISYRRGDTRDFVEKLFPWFLMRYGAGNVFLDYASIPEFENFDHFIEHKIRECDVFVCIIGPQWLDMLQERAQRNDVDFVLREIELAIGYEKMLAPILVDYAPPPSLSDVPQSIAPLLRVNFAELPDAIAIYQRIHGLFEHIERHAKPHDGRPLVRGEATADWLAFVRPENFDVFAAIDQMTQAREREDWAEALNLIALIKAYGNDIPPEFKLEDRQVRYTKRLHDAQAQREREERAAYAYQFVQKMVALRDPAEEIQRALLGVWGILPMYDPDNIAAQFGGSLIETKPTPTQASPEPAPTASLTTSSQPMPVWPREDLLPAPFGWCYVPTGEIYLKHERGSYVPDGGQTVAVAGFFISTYPITNGQYRAFLKADDGYGLAGWWDFADVARAWRDQHPHPNNRRDNDLPCTGINWYDAVAFSRWLRGRMGAAVQLPSEPQWQLAAQGPDGRLYPWGDDEPTPDRANVTNWHHKPVSVLRYPNGASPYGVMDMAGNVQEWCLTAWATGDNTVADAQAKRVLRGGSWQDTFISIRTTSRLGMVPGAERPTIGFRVVLLPTA